MLYGNSLIVCEKCQPEIECLASKLAKPDDLSIFVTQGHSPRAQEQLFEKFLIILALDISSTRVN